MNDRLVTVARWSSSPIRSTAGRIERDLLLRLSQRGGPEVLVVVLAAAREAHLAGVRAQLPRAPGEHHVQLAVVLVERRQHRRRRDRSRAALALGAHRRAGRGQRAPNVVERRAAALRRQVGPRRRPAGPSVERTRDDLLAAAPVGHRLGGRREVLAGRRASRACPGRRPRGPTGPVDRTGRRRPPRVGRPAVRQARASAPCAARSDSSRSRRPWVFRLLITLPGGVSPFSHSIQSASSLAGSGGGLSMHRRLPARPV